MKLSIIIPVYNSQKYLHECIDSVLAQTLTDFEIILVDDGSTDNSPAICDQYAQKDPRVVVIHKENGGQADARNKGLDIARGDYIGFVDSDDHIVPNMYEDMYNAAVSNNVSIVGCHMKHIDDNKVLKTVGTETGNHTVYKSTEVINDFTNISKIFHFALWSKIYSKEIFKDLRLPKGFMYEDAYVVLDVLDRCDKFLIIDKCYYKYRVSRPESITNSAYEYSHTDRLELYNKAMEFYKERNLIAPFHDAMSCFVDTYIPNHILIYSQFKQYKEKFGTYKKQAISRIPAVLKNKRILKLKKFLYLCLFISPRLSMKICKKYFPESFVGI